MKIMTAAAIAAISASLWTVGVAEPAQAAPPGCVDAKQGLREMCPGGTHPVCSADGPGGLACTNCTGALAAARVSDGDALTQSWWDCGMGVGQGARPAVTSTPHCFVNGVSTGQPKPPCFGNYVPDGNGGAKTDPY